uniref:Uncharacterized protein n=1 Tax=Panagrolaimus sp. ES5 TaxID=591445 RepID=A0AC34GRY9_9BILA
MLPRQNSEDSTTPLLLASDSSDVSFYLPTTSSSTTTNPQNSTTKNRRFNRRKLSRETSFPSFDYEDDDHPFLIPSSSTIATTHLTALEEVDEVAAAPLTPLFSSSTFNDKNVPPFSSSSSTSNSSTSTFRPTTISEPTTSVSSPSRDNSGANLRRGSLVKKLSIVGEFFETAAEVAVAPKKTKNSKLGEILKARQGSLDIKPLSFDFGEKPDIEELLNQRINAVIEDLLEQHKAMSEQNDFRGFQFVKQLISKGWGKIGFWIIVTVLAVLTFKDVVELTLEYAEDPKQSDMNIVFNESMTMPNITFCMSRTQAWSHFSINTNESTEEWDEKIEDFMKNMTSHDEFLTKPWDYRMVMEGYDVIATLNSMERETTPQGSARSINVFSGQARLGTKRKMVKKWLKALQDRGVSFEEFTQKVGSETIRRSMQRFQRTTFDEDLVIKTRFRTSWISMMQFCFQPWFDRDNFHAIDDQGNFFTMVLSHNPEKLAGKSVDCMTVDFHGRPSSLSRFMEGKGRTRDGFNEEAITVEVRARYVMLENDDSGIACNYLEEGEDNEFDCRSRCRMNMIREMCNCTALTLSYLASKGSIQKYPLCDYSNCSVNLQNNNYTDEKCSSKCLRDCNQIRYEIDHETKGKSVRGDLTTVYLNWGSFEFLTLEQKRIWSIPTFIAALGGSIGMWLGLSILSLLQGATYVFYLISESKKRHKARTESRIAANPFANPYLKKSSKVGPPPKYEDTQEPKNSIISNNNNNNNIQQQNRTNIQIE